MSKEPLILLGYPLERPAVDRPVTFAGVCMALFVIACYVAEAILNRGDL